jgi:hypothetical protein
MPCCAFRVTLFFLHPDDVHPGFLPDIRPVSGTQESQKKDTAYVYKQI